jgi:hypothetical protein
VVDAKRLALFVNSLELAYTGVRFTSGTRTWSADSPIDPGRAARPGNTLGLLHDGYLEIGTCAQDHAHIRRLVAIA